MTAPDYWFLLCQSMFATGPDLAAQLWEHLPQADAVAWQLKILQARGSSLHAAVERTRRLTAVLTPAMLLEASICLEPEGKPRSKEIQQFEAQVLRLTAGDGTWHS